jgi:hypothetical protein
MATEFIGRGDPQRSLDLFWGTAKTPTRGPKPGLSVAGLGLNGREMISVVSLVGGYVKGAAAETAQVTQQTGETDNEWWSAREPLRTKYFDPERNPTSVAVYTMGVFDPADGNLDYNMQNAMDDFGFGPQRILDGVDVFIQRQQAEQPAR